MILILFGNLSGTIYSPNQIERNVCCLNINEWGGGGGGTGDV